MGRTCLVAKRRPIDNVDALYAAICRQALEDAKGDGPLAEEAESFLLIELSNAQPLVRKVIYGDSRTRVN
jgi:hypothetical protein